MFIPDPSFFHPGSAPKNLSIFTKKRFLSSRKYDPGCSSRILIFLQMTEPESRGQKGTGSRIRIRNTGKKNTLLRALHQSRKNSGYGALTSTLCVPAYLPNSVNQMPRDNEHSYVPAVISVTRFAARRTSELCCAGQGLKLNTEDSGMPRRVCLGTALSSSMLALLPPLPSSSSGSEMSPAIASTAGTTCTQTDRCGVCK